MIQPQIPKAKSKLKLGFARPKRELLKGSLMAFFLMMIAVAATSPITSSAKPPTNLIFEAITPATAEAQSVGAGSISSSPLGGPTAQVAPAPTGSPKPSPTPKAKK